jgi:hypothetical protein
MSHINEQLKQYFDDALRTLEDLSSAEGIAIEWEEGQPVSVSREVFLEDKLRGFKTTTGATLGSLFPKLDADEIFERYMQRYQTERAIAAQAADELTKENDQLETGILDIQNKLAEIQVKVKQLDRVPEVKALLATGRAKVDESARAVSDAERMREVNYKPAIERLRSGWLRAIGIGAPLSKWTVKDSPPHWAGAMNVLVKPDSAFTVDEFPLRWTEEYNQAKIRKEPIAVKNVHILARSARHLDALRELQRLAVLRVDFFERSGKARHEVLRNVSRTLRVLYYALVEFAKLPLSLQEPVVDVMQDVARNTLTYEYWYQFLMNFSLHPSRKFKLPLRVLGPTSAQQLNWVNWVLVKLDWYKRKEFRGEEYRRLREAAAEAKKGDNVPI